MAVALVQITDPDDPRLWGMHALMDRTFAPHERDGIAVTRAELRDFPERLLVFIAVDDADDGVAGYATGALLPLLEQGGHAVQGAAFLCGCHLDRDPRYRGHTIGERLVAARLQAAQAQAQARGLRLVGFLAECSDKERFFNAVLARRMYVQPKPGHYAELPYYQPPTAWDRHGNGIVVTSTGERPFAAHCSPQHLMFAPPPGQSVPTTIATDLVLGMVRAMFWYNCLENHGMTEGTPRALRRLGQTIDAYEADLATVLATAPDGRLHLLSQSQRQLLQANGATVLGHRKETA